MYPDIKISKSANPSDADPGSIINFTILVENMGDTTLDPVRVIDNLPEDMSYVIAHPLPDTIMDNTIIWDNVGPISSGSSKTIYLLAQIDENLSSSEIWVDNSWFSQNDVDAYNSSLIWQVNAFRTIQNAINVANNCEIVYVRSGIYSEQILINKSISLIAEPGVTLKIPNNPEYFTIEGSSSTWTPVIFAYGGIMTDNDVSGNDTISVTVDGFNFDNNNKPNLTGILFHNIGCGTYPTFLNNSVTVTGTPICGTNVSDQDYCNITGMERYLESVISNNTIVDFDIGIMVNGCSNCGKIIHNHIQWAYHTIGKTGILISGSDNCEPENIDIHYNYIGVDCGDNIGIFNQVSNIMNATLNWWSSPDGPDSPFDGDNFDPITGRIADGFGEKVVGLVHFDPWAGIDASMNVSQSSVMVGESIFFDSSSSFACHINGSFFDFFDVQWKFDDGSYSFDDSTYYNYDDPGIYHVSLRVKAIDMQLWPYFMYDWDHTIITVTQPGMPLVANADAQNLGVYEGEPGNSIHFNGCAIGGTPPYSYSWDFGDGSPSQNGQNPSHVFAEDNIYSVSLIVVDSDGQEKIDTTEVIISSGILIAYSNGPSFGNVNDEIYFSGYSIGGTSPYSYLWDFGDGSSPESGKMVSHVYDIPGKYTVILGVTDSLGNADNVSHQIVVNSERPEGYIETANLKSGWNFVSLPVNQIVDKTNLYFKYDTFFLNWTQAISNNNPAGESVIIPYIFGWDRNGQYYSINDVFKVGYGYWIYSEINCSLFSEIGNLNETGDISMLETGWNLVGIPFDHSINKTELIVDGQVWNFAVDTNLVSDYIFGWDALGQHYEFVDVFVPGYCYWVFASKECFLKYNV